MNIDAIYSIDCDEIEKNRSKIAWFRSIYSSWVENKKLSAYLSWYKIEILKWTSGYIPEVYNGNY